MYLDRDEKEERAKELAALYNDERILIAFAKQCAELYDTTDEFTADDILRRMRKHINK